MISTDISAFSDPRVSVQLAPSSFTCKNYFVEILNEIKSSHENLICLCDAASDSSSCSFHTYTVQLTPNEDSLALTLMPAADEPASPWEKVKEETSERDTHKKVTVTRIDGLLCKATRRVYIIVQLLLQKRWLVEKKPIYWTMLSTISQLLRLTGLNREEIQLEENIVCYPKQRRYLFTKVWDCIFLTAVLGIISFLHCSCVRVMTWGLKSNTVHNKEKSTAV